MTFWYKTEFTLRIHDKISSVRGGIVYEKFITHESTSKIYSRR